MALTDNLISYWKMDESSGNALDAHASHDLIDTNTVGSATGIIGNARDHELSYFEYFGIVDHSDFSLTGDMSISCWIKPESTPGSSANTIVSKSTDPVCGNMDDEYSLAMTVYGGGSLSWTFSDGMGAPGQVFWSSVLSTATWYNVVCWHDAAAMEVGITVNDGTPVTEMWSMGGVDGTNNFLIGSVHGGGSYFDGLIDEVGIWDKVLSSDEITELFNSGAGLTYPFTDSVTPYYYNLLASV